MSDVGDVFVCKTVFVVDADRISAVRMTGESLCTLCPRLSARVDDGAPAEPVNCVAQPDRTSPGALRWVLSCAWARRG